MNLANIMKVQDQNLRKLLFEDWKKDNEWKRKMESRVEELEKKYRPPDPSRRFVVPNTSSLGMAFKRVFQGGD